MRPDKDNLQHLLVELGKAHREGAFSSSVGGFPWRQIEPKVLSLRHRHFAWARVAVSLAAAAAIAAVFVGPNMLKPRTAHQFVENVPVIVSTDVDSKLNMHEATSGSSAVAECDFNNDGAVDGQDIQALMDRVHNPDGTDIRLQAEQLQKCLLGV